MKRRDNDEALSRERSDQVAMEQGRSSAPSVAIRKRNDAMRKQNHGEIDPRRDRRVATGGDRERPSLKWNLGGLGGICDQRIEGDRILHRNARDPRTKHRRVRPRGRDREDQYRN